MQRAIYFAYGLGCYLMFLAVYAYMAGFVGNIVAPKTIDSGTAGPAGLAAIVDVALLAMFGLQHSVMARPGFKRVWTKIIPQPIERSTYVLFSNLAVIAIMWLWQPITWTIWDVPDGAGRYALYGLFACGWLMVPLVSLMISHFDLFGLRQVWLHWRGQEYSALPFRTPLLYGYVRHPLYVGWFLAFWMTPTMTAGHLLFAGMLTGYMVIAAKIEERDLVDHFGRLYDDYRRSVPAFVPRIGGRKKSAAEGTGTLSTG